MTATLSDASAPDQWAKYKVLAGAIIVQLVLGTVYGYSIFWEPLTANIFPPVITEQQLQLKMTGVEVLPNEYVVVQDEAEAQKERAKQQGILKYAFSICILSFAAVMVIAGRVQDIKGPRVPAIIGGW